MPKKRTKNRKTIPLNIKSLGNDISAYPFVEIKWLDRSEERRVGKECRSRWSPYH